MGEGGSTRVSALYWGGGCKPPGRAHARICQPALTIVCTYNAGHRGATRWLSSVLRDCECFFTEIFVDCDTTRHILYQSEKSFLPPRNKTRLVQLSQDLQSSAATAGTCRFEYDLCSYSQQLVLRDVNYKVSETMLRRFVLNISRPSSEPAVVSSVSVAAQQA